MPSIHVNERGVATKQTVIKEKDEVVKSANGMMKGAVFLVVYSNHCGACHMFMPIAKEFVENNAVDSLLIEASNIGNVMKMCKCLKDINVPYYPLIGCVSPSGFEEYDGPRTQDALKSFMDVKRTKPKAAVTKKVTKTKPKVTKKKTLAK